MSRIPPISASEADLAYESAQKVVETHRRLAGFIKEGMTLAQIDAFVGQTLEDLGCKSCFLGYRVPRSPAFPSHACLSLNECVVHGTAAYTSKPLAPGDLLSIDVGVLNRGWIGDAAWTYAISERTELAERLMRAGTESISRGVEQLKPGNTLLEWARAVQTCVEKEYGFHLTKGLGGHGYGRKLHGPPFVSNSMPSFPGEWPDSRVVCEPGMLLAVEPMIAVGTGNTKNRSKEWPVFTADGSLSVHYEHDVLVTESGPRVLTEGLQDLPEIVG
ncbi:MAG: type I methionyl aminopeptidase [Phycisphaera sp.]|nr:MAG: type I methionyl aminopeptidase [Phycisphaera sp.]